MGFYCFEYENQPYDVILCVNTQQYVSFIPTSTPLHIHGSQFHIYFSFNENLLKQKFWSLLATDTRTNSSTEKKKHFIRKQPLAKYQLRTLSQHFFVSKLFANIINFYFLSLALSLCVCVFLFISLSTLFMCTFDYRCYL